MSRTLNLYFDGGNEKGIATWAVVAKEGEKVVAKLTGLVCEKLPQTNNVAEWCSLYMAVVYVGTIATTQIYDKFVFVGDSELIVKQARGEYAVSSPNIKGLAENTIRMISDISHEHGCLIEIQWIPRELNKEADALGRTIR